jgi:hypothetical protein
MCSHLLEIHFDSVLLGKRRRLIDQKWHWKIQLDRCCNRFQEYGYLGLNIFRLSKMCIRSLFSNSPRTCPLGNSCTPTGPRCLGIAHFHNRYKAADPAKVARILLGNYRRLPFFREFLKMYHQRNLGTPSELGMG